ncbi:MAG: glycosyltransferase [Hyphomonadaceae bacterium]|nr:glycosyltransferase [Hyphomonadaceae bacterium]
MPDLSIVICTLNEAGAIGGVIDEIGAAFAGRSHEIIVVDDDSKDGTHDVVRQRARAGAPVRLVVRRGRRGLSSAAIEGWNAARGARLAIMDGDGQHDPRTLRALDDAVAEGRADLAVMSRYHDAALEGFGRRRAAMSRMATWFTSLVLHSPLTDPMSGMFVMRRALFEEARPKLTGVGFKILADVVSSLHTRPRIFEASAQLRTRVAGESKLDLRVIFDLAGLLTEKATGGVIPARFVPFALVGATGVLVHAVFLTIGVKALALPFALAQGIGIWVTMTWNYWLNNNLTFRDRRRRGWSFVYGAFLFYLACAGGAIIAELSATAMHRVNVHWLAAGVFGALLSGVWNFVASSFLTWRAPRKAVEETQGSVEEIPLDAAQSTASR